MLTRDTPAVDDVSISTEGSILPISRSCAHEVICCIEDSSRMLAVPSLFSGSTQASCAFVVATLPCVESDDAMRARRSSFSRAAAKGLRLGPRRARASTSTRAAGPNDKIQRRASQMPARMTRFREELRKARSWGRSTSRAAGSCRMRSWMCASRSAAHPHLAHSEGRKISLRVQVVFSPE